MSVLTEAALRVLLKNADLDAMSEYRVEKDVIVTPSARAWLSDHKINLVTNNKKEINVITGNKNVKNQEQPMKAQDKKSVLPDFEKPARFTGLAGGYYEEKPEHMTALYGNVLVTKDHPRIALRGKIDSLEAQIVKTQIAFLRLNLSRGVAALEEVLKYVQDILRCEVLNLPLEPLILFGMEENELRARSHTPKKYYGIPHFAASVSDGEAVVLLNELRTASREVELAAFEAFKQKDGTPEREDIITAFNRLSSVFYVMMFQAKTGEYANEN